MEPDRERACVPFRPPAKLRAPARLPLGCPRDRINAVPLCLTPRLPRQRLGLPRLAVGLAAAATLAAADTGFGEWRYYGGDPGAANTLPSIR